MAIKLLAFASVVAVFGKDTEVMNLPNNSNCSTAWESCQESLCCQQGFICYEKDLTYAQCRPGNSCKPGVQPRDPVKTHWSCRILGPNSTKRNGTDDACSPGWGHCHETKCCTEGFTCYEKNHYYSQCRPTGNCTPGIHSGDPLASPWSCHEVKPPSKLTTRPPSLETRDMLAGQAACGVAWSSCSTSHCCEQNLTCYEKDHTYAQCQPTGHCIPGIHSQDPLKTHWSCRTFRNTTLEVNSTTEGCSHGWGTCNETKCCEEGFTCYKKSVHYSQCRPTGDCTPGVHPDDPIATPWACNEDRPPANDTSTAAPSTTTTPALRGSKGSTNSSNDTDQLCGPAWSNCHAHKCCEEGLTCYEKDITYAQCQPTGACQQGTQPDDPVKTHWTCRPLEANTSQGNTTSNGCSIGWLSCQQTKCCDTGFTCYEKDSYYSQCRPTGNCKRGVHPEDPHASPWSCRPIEETTTTTVGPK